MDAYSIANWGTVFSALATSAAALTGLLFVALSINLRQVIEKRGLAGRAMEVLILLTAALIAATLLLMPGQSSATVALEVLTVAAVEAVSMAVIQARTPVRALGISVLSMTSRVIADQTAPVLLAVGGVTLLIQNGGGLYWVVAALLVALVSSIVGAWVLLVEIAR